MTLTEKILAMTTWEKIEAANDILNSDSNAHEFWNAHCAKAVDTLGMDWWLNYFLSKHM